MRPLVSHAAAAARYRIGAATNILLARRPRFVVTGTGRCGTRHVAAYLNAVGIPCSHEGYFTPDGPTLRNSKRAASAKGDVSWLAVPFLKRGNLPIVHLVRQPHEVIRSLYNIGFFDRRFRDVHGPFIAFAERHFEVGEDPFDACLRWYIEWNERCEAVAGLRIRVENLEDRLGDLTRHIGLEPSQAASPPPMDFNHWPPLHPRPLCSSDLAQRIRRHPRADALAEIAARYGYSVDAPA